MTVIDVNTATCNVEDTDYHGFDEPVNKLFQKAYCVEYDDYYIDGEYYD